jgi:hypothetical protein
MYTILQIIISVIVIYLIFSVVVFVIVEWLSGITQMRGRMLEKAIKGMFNNHEIGRQILSHPVVKNLAAQRKRRPAYLPASSIAAAIIDIVGTKGAAAGQAETYERFMQGVDNLPDEDLKKLLRSLAQRARNLETLTETIEKWYNDGMERLSGWYKVNTRWVAFIIALLVTGIFNVDTIYIIRVAKADPVLRQRMNDLGDKIMADSAFFAHVNSLPPFDTDYYEEYENDSTIKSDTFDLQTADQHGPVAMSPDERLQQLNELGQFIRESDLPIGWHIKNEDPMYYIVLGWFLTALALTAGAPFWFDVLKKLVNVRSSGLVSTTTPSKDKSQ